MYRLNFNYLLSKHDTSETELSKILLQLTADNCNLPGKSKKKKKKDSSPHEFELSMVKIYRKT